MRPVSRGHSRRGQRTETILTEHIDQLHLVSEVLVKFEKVDKDQFESLMTTGKLPEELVETKVENTDEIAETTKTSDNA